MTSGTVTASVRLIRGAKKARGIIARAHARTYHTTAALPVEKANPATPEVLAPPMLSALRERATSPIPILRPPIMKSSEFFSFSALTARHMRRRQKVYETMMTMASELTSIPLESPLDVGIVTLIQCAGLE
jgi:hypothetical protein